MAGIFNKLIDFMDEEEWKYEILEGEDVLRFHFKGSAGRVLCYADVDEEKSWLIFYSYLPVNAPAEKMHEMAEFLTRANRGMRIGNFELDFEDGEIRYKTSIDIEGGELTSKMIDNLLRANLSTMNRYFPGMMELIYSGKPAKDLIQKIEGSEETPISSTSDGDSEEDEDEDENESEEFEGYTTDDDDEEENEKKTGS